MKIRKYILSLVAAAGCAVCVAAIADGRNDDKQEKVKPAENMPAKVDTQRSPYSLINLAGSEDGIPYGLRLMEVDNKDVSLSWNTPEATDGYWDDFETHDDRLRDARRLRNQLARQCRLAVYRRRQREDVHVAGLHLPQYGTEDGLHRDEPVDDIAGDRHQP